MRFSFSAPPEEGKSPAGRKNKNKQYMKEDI